MRLSDVCKLFVAIVGIALFASREAGAVNPTLWDLVSPKIPSDAKAVFQVDAGRIRSSALLAPLKSALSQTHTIDTDVVQQVCNFDPLAAINSAVLVVTHEEDAVVYVETSGLTVQKLTACIAALAAREGAAVKTKIADSVVEVTHGTEKRYFGWINGKVLVFAGKLEDRKRLTRALGNAKERFDEQAAVERVLEKVNRAAAVWAIVAQVPKPGQAPQPLLAYGSIDLVAGRAIADVHGVCARAADTATIAQNLNQQLAEAKGNINKSAVAPQVARLVGSVRIVAVDKEVVGTGTFAQADVASVLQAALEPH
jgi:hypothetical protein